MWKKSKGLQKWDLEHGAIDYEKGILNPASWVEGMPNFTEPIYPGFGVEMGGVEIAKNWWKSMKR